MIAAAIVVSPGCGSEGSTTSPEPAATTADTEVPDDETSPTTVAGTDEPEDARPTGGWQSIGIDEVSPNAFPPCCASDWYGEPSPPLTEDGADLADGEYFVRADWPADVGDPLQLEVFRFERSALLPDDSCESPPGDVDEVGDVPTDVGVDDSSSRGLTVRLDDSVGAIVVGGDDAVGTGWTAAIESGTGSDLAELAAAVEQAYDEVFAGRFRAGESRADIIEDVLDTPRGGFTPSTSSVDGFVYTPPSGPRLLFQVVLPVIPGPDSGHAGRGTDVLAINSIEVRDGVVTLRVYAGFSS